MNLSSHSPPQMARAPSYKHKVATIRKNAMERTNIALDKHNGNDLVNIAVGRDSSGSHSLNRMKGTARYVTVPTCLLRDLIPALQDAEAKSSNRRHSCPATTPPFHEACVV